MTPQDFLDRAGADLLPGDGPTVPLKVALRAISLALDHKDKYKDFLSTALINAARSNQPQPTEPC